MSGRDGRLPALIVVAGGGPAAIETLLAVRALAGERAQLELIAPEPDLVVRVRGPGAPLPARRARRGAAGDLECLADAVMVGAGKLVGRYLAPYLAALDERR